MVEHHAAGPPAAIQASSESAAAPGWREMMLLSKGPLVPCWPCQRKYPLTGALRRLGRGGSTRPRGTVPHRRRVRLLCKLYCFPFFNNSFSGGGKFNSGKQYHVSKPDVKAYFNGPERPAAAHPLDFKDGRLPVFDVERMSRNCVCTET